MEGETEQWLDHCVGDREESDQSVGVYGDGFFGFFLDLMDFF